MESLGRDHAQALRGWPHVARVRQRDGVHAARCHLRYAQVRQAGLRRHHVVPRRARRTRLSGGLRVLVASKCVRLRAGASKATSCPALDEGFNSPVASERCNNTQELRLDNILRERRHPWEVASSGNGRKLMQLEPHISQQERYNTNVL